MPRRIPFTLSRREFVAAALAAPQFRLASPPRYDLILRGGPVFDGSGAPGHEADVAVRHGRITAVARRLGSSAGEVIDVRGLAVAPGFIDIHSHADGNLFTDPR